MKLSIPVMETIQKRHSVRTYKNRPLPPQEDANLHIHYKDFLADSRVKGGCFDETI